MQIILTEEEHSELLMKVADGELGDKITIQDLCRQVATYKPIKGWHAEDAVDGKAPWGCILNEFDYVIMNSDDDEIFSMGYCDDCPVQDLCPYEYKKWSK